MTLVVDASVAVRWFVDGPFQDEARGLRHVDDDLIAPTLMLAETGNTLWQLVRADQASREDAVAALALLASRTPQLLEVPPLLPRAIVLATELDHPVDDCIYLALAEQQDARVITADRRFADRGARHSVLWIEALG
jgi:predicted nucleic acid-binding protein